ncbi:hypothetical protein evm_006084 [Chilo suppressalis]|nr:hypothetical protein evm_006084 [Chilo suppressalis]
MEGFKKYTMFKSLRPHYRLLDKTAFLYTKKHLPGDKKSFYDSDFAAAVSWTFISLYNVQLFIKGIQDRHSTDELVNTLFLFLTTVTAIVKQVAFTVRMKRIKQLFDTTDGRKDIERNY